MKKVLVAAFALASLTASAQKNSLLVGGGLDFTSSKDASLPNDIKETSFGFMPVVGYQFHENWTAGAVATIGTYKHTNSADVVDSKYSAFGVGPFVRYTKTLSNTFSLFGQLQGIFGSSKNKLSGSKVTSSKVQLFPAVFINVKNGFGLNFDFGGIGYESTKPSGGSASSDFNVNFGKTMNIGISKNFSFGKKK